VLQTLLHTNTPQQYLFFGSVAAREGAAEEAEPVPVYLGQDHINYSPRVNNKKN